MYLWLPNMVPYFEMTGIQVTGNSWEFNDVILRSYVLYTIRFVVKHLRLLHS